MKKGWRVLALALTVAQMTPVSAYAAQGNNVETVFYNGREIDRANLSKDTISWLEWYNSLPKKEQNAVNYEPDGVQKKSDAFTQVEEALYASDTDTWQEWFASLSQNVQNTVNYNPDEPMHGETVDAVSKSKSKKDIVLRHLRKKRFLKRQKQTDRILDVAVPSVRQKKMKNLKKMNIK